MPEHDRLPHLSPLSRNPIVFITAVTIDRNPILACDRAHHILRDIWLRSPAFDGWSVGRYTIMPDHVHLFARATQDAKPLSRWVQTWKSLSSRRLMENSQVRSPVWQRDYFDRYLRSADSYTAKWNYISENPIRKGLVQSATDWPWQGVLEDLSF